MQSHKKGTKNTQAVADTNSYEFGRQGESSDSRHQVQRQPSTKRRKSVASSCAHQSGLRRNLGLARVTSYFVLDPCVKNFWTIFVCWQALAKFFTASYRWQSFTKFRIVVALHTRKSARNTSVKICSIKLSPIFSPVSVTVFGNCRASSPDCVVSASGVIHNQPFSFCAGAQCWEVLVPRFLNLFSIFLPTFLILLS